jgi:uncharacterized damage-inducible protein DinB
MLGRAQMKENIIAPAALRELYEYNYWARDRQLDACLKLEEEKFLRPMGSSFSSLRDTLVHVLGAEWIWLERFCGRSPRSMPSWLDELQTCSSIAQRWRNVELDMRGYLTQVNRESLSGPLSHINLAGSAAFGKPPDLPSRPGIHITGATRGDARVGRFSCVF